MSVSGALLFQQDLPAPIAGRLPAKTRRQDSPANRLPGPGGPRFVLKCVVL